MKEISSVGCSSITNCYDNKLFKRMFLLKRNEAKNLH